MNLLACGTLDEGLQVVVALSLEVLVDGGAYLGECILREVGHDGEGGRANGGGAIGGQLPMPEDVCKGGGGGSHLVGELADRAPPAGLDDVFTDKGGSDGVFGGTYAMASPARLPFAGAGLHPLVSPVGTPVSHLGLLPIYDDGAGAIEDWAAGKDDEVGPDAGESE